jgi:D-alanyl-lipoteichoic acid acyltransferase DltB (MBOAT superfamily)
MGMNFSWFTDTFSAEHLRVAVLDALRYSTKEPWFFTEFTFLATFGIFLLGYALLFKQEWLRKVYIILFSLFFYYKSSGPFLLLFGLMIVSDYLFAIQIEKAQGRKRKLYVWLAIGYSLSFLLYFKYVDFFIANCNNLLHTDFSAKSLFLPIGISFYTFQSISYILDVYRKDIPATKDFVDYTFYMTFFPHLVAGPIVRAKDFLPQIFQPQAINTTLFKDSIFRIIIGLVKKLFIADYLAKYADLVHLAPSAYSGGENLLAMYAYTFQIYFDFSGYSDIAIGIALMLGYKLKENFDNPYTASNITIFWRKWHISLSSWLRDYIYIPLGGNRKGEVNMYVFLFITMLVGGFWHGADWRFVFWGFAHGAALAFHKAWSTLLETKEGAKAEHSANSPWYAVPAKIGNTLLTFHFVAVCWIFFRARSFQSAYDSIRTMLFKSQWVDFQGFWFSRPEIVIMLCVAASIVFFPVVIKQQLFGWIKKIPAWLWIFIMLFALQIITQFRDDVVQPFIYFQF